MICSHHGHHGEPVPPSKPSIPSGTEIVSDKPLAAAIYGIEVMPIKYGFKHLALKI